MTDNRPPVVRISIRYKLLGLLAGILLAAMGTYLALALQLITEDRLAYAFDLNRAVAKNLSAQVHATIESVNDRLLLYGETIVAESDLDARDRLIERLIESDPDLVRVTIFERRRGKLARSSEIASAERLTPLELTLDDLAGLDISIPIPVEAAAHDEVVLLNRSLPPSAQLLTIAVAPPTADGEAAPWAIAADMTQDRLLQIFSESTLYSAFVVDVDGIVLSHPESGPVLERRKLDALPVVTAALDNRAAQGGAVEYEAEDGTSLLGAWAPVPVARLSVISEIDRDTALAAARRLIRLSLLFGIAIVLVAFLVTIVFARAITTPIRRLQEATTALAAGQYDVDPGVRLGDEIGDLARAFKRMAHEIREAQTSLIQSEKMAAFGQLGAGITHEVKNPLGAIRGFAQLALQFQEDPEQVKESLQLIESETNRCLDIVQNFLTFARADAATMEVTDIDDAARQGVKIVAHQLSTSGVRMHTDIGGAPKARANAAQLQQVMLNLALNAMQAVGRGGNVWVGTRRREDGNAEISVRDDGPGIPPDIQQRIFEPFFTTKETGKGTGLGLSVSYGILQDHDGQLLVESTVGDGTTFRIVLPAADD